MKEERRTFGIILNDLIIDVGESIIVKIDEK